MIQPGVNPGLPATLSETTHKQPALCQLVPLRPGKVGGSYDFHLQSYYTGILQALPYLQLIFKHGNKGH